MYQERTFLYIIPARAGSKRLPHKNTLMLSGKPLISWTLEAASKSNYSDEIVVTSDSSEILDIAKNFKCTTIQRPDNLAEDNSTTVDVLMHTISFLENKYDYLVLLQPTSPLRTEQHINEAIEFLCEKNADAVISVCECDHSPLWSNTIPESSSMDNFLRDELKNKRSQDLEQYFRLNGAIYICKIERFLKDKTLFFSDNIYAYKMSKYDSVDIDEKIDLIFAQTLKDMN